MAVAKSPKTRFAILALWIVSAMGLAAFALNAGSSSAATDQLYYSTTFATKQNAQQVGSNPHLVTAQVAALSGPLDSVRIESTGAPANGVLRIDTSDTSTWKLANKTAASTWTITSKTTSVANAAVYINGAYVPLRAGATITLKFVGAARSGVYVKVVGQTVPAAGGTPIAIEAEAAEANSLLLNTPTPTNTATNTSTNTPTDTPEPPTSTYTNTPTNTPVPPTSTYTNTPTNTPVPPTSTYTNTPTNTAVPPTSTYTNTPTNTAVPS